MNTQKIVFTADSTEKTIEVKGCFPYLVNQATGKVVLRISASEEDTTFDDLHALKNNDNGIVELYERTVDPETEEAGEWELKNTYEDYDSGEVSISYQNGQYSCDVTRMGKFEKMVAQTRADVDYLAVMADIPLE